MSVEHKIAVFDYGSDSVCWPLLVTGTLTTYNPDGSFYYTLYKGDTWQGGDGSKEIGTYVTKADEDSEWYSLIAKPGRKLLCTNHILTAGETITLNQGERLFVAEGSAGGYTNTDVIRKDSAGSVELMVDVDCYAVVFTVEATP